MLVEQGQIIALTTGEWSDYCLRGHVRVLVDFDVAEQISRFKRLQTVGENDNAAGMFVAWAIREGLVEADEGVVELYLGNEWGSLEPCAKALRGGWGDGSGGPMSYDEILDPRAEQWARQQGWKPKRER